MYIPTLNDKIIYEFVSLCNWAYSNNMLHRALFDDNLNPGKMAQAPLNNVFARLSVITSEYALLQIAKLHDRAIQNGRVNLSINYIFEYGDWSPEIKQKLGELMEDMNKLYISLKPARHKALSHNDLESILDGSVLGAFEKDADLIYFKKLLEFAKISFEAFHEGKKLEFKDTLKEEVDAFILAINLETKVNGAN